MHSAWWLGSGLLMRMPLVNEYSLQTLRNNTLLLQCKCGRSKTPRICLTQAGMFVLNWILLVLLLSSSCSQSWPCSVLSTCTPSNPKNRSDTCFSPSIVFPYKFYLFIYIFGSDFQTVSARLGVGSWTSFLLYLCRCLLQKIILCLQSTVLFFTTFLRASKCGL